MGITYEMEAEASDRPSFKYKRELKGYNQMSFGCILELPKVMVTIQGRNKDP